MLLVRRSFAFLLDILILFVVLVPAGLLVQSLMNYQPITGPEIWTSVLWNFSIPAWIYFILSDMSRNGATPGKRILGLGLRRLDSDMRLGIWLSFGRNTIKLLPWELVHFSAFAISHDLNQLNAGQTFGLTLANVLIVIYLVTAAMSGGRRSVHDYAAGTELVRRDDGGVSRPGDVSEREV